MYLRLINVKAAANLEAAIKLASELTTVANWEGHVSEGSCLIWIRRLFIICHDEWAFPLSQSHRLRARWSEAAHFTLSSSRRQSCETHRHGEVQRRWLYQV